MATAAIRGDERFEYTPPGGALTTHLLAVPLQEVEAIDTRPRTEWWSADGTARRVVTIGTGVRELRATVRMEDQPGNLKALLRAGLHDDVTITYRRAALGTAYPCKLVTVEGGEAGVRRDREKVRTWEARIHIRRVDGGTFDALL